MKAHVIYLLDIPQHRSSSSEGKYDILLSMDDQNVTLHDDVIKWK